MEIRWTNALPLAVAMLAVAAPGQAQAPSQDQPRREVVEISFPQVKHQRLVAVSIKGQGPFTFLLDTGVTGAAIDLALAARLGMELPAGAAAGAQGSSRVYQTWITDLAISLGLDSLQAAACRSAPSPNGSGSRSTGFWATVS